MTTSHVTLTIGSAEVDIILTVTERQPEGDRVALHDTAEGEDESAKLEWTVMMLESSAMLLRQAADADRAKSMPSGGGNDH